MDQLLNVGKSVLQSQMQGGQGGDSGNKSSGGNNDLLQNAAQHAMQFAGSSGNSDLFANIAGAVGQKQDKLANEELDEQDAVKQHDHAYNNDGKGDSHALGTAAAMQALKMFNQSNNSAGSGAGQAAFLGMAMSEASKLFDNKAAAGKVSDGASKENTIQKAGEMAMKMYLQSQGGSQGGLMGMASKLLG